MNKLLITAAAIAALVTGTASAKDIEIGGNVTQSANLRDVTQRVIGNGNTADQNIATIRGSVRVGGNVTQSVNARDVTQWVIGNGNAASQTIGTITSK